MNGINIQGNVCKDNAVYGLRIPAVAAGNISEITLKNNILHDNTTADYSHQFIMDYTNARVETTGTVDITYEEATVLDSSGGAITATLGSGYYIGQIKTIVMRDATTSSTVTVTLHDDVAGDPAIADADILEDGPAGTFDAVDETWILLWTGTEWTTLRATCTFV